MSSSTSQTSSSSSVLEQCAVCKDAVDRTHKCPHCLRPVHIFCGKPIGEEGFGQEVLCLTAPCISAGEPQPSHPSDSSSEESEVQGKGKGKRIEKEKKGKEDGKANGNRLGSNRQELVQITGKQLQLSAEVENRIISYVFKI